MAWLGTWAKRREITVSNTNIDSNLTHFPLLLSLSTSAGTGSTDISSIFDELTSDANRKKIAVTKSDGTTQIYAEIEKWDDANEKAWLWVSKSDLVLSSSGTTTLYLYYDSSQSDNTTYIGDTTDAVTHNVWDSNFEMVQHMKDDPDTSSISDSTSNANDGDKLGAGEPAVTTSGKIGNAQDFDKTDDKIDCGNFNHLSVFTLEAWIKAGTDVTDHRTIIDKEENYLNRNYWLSIDGTTGVLSLRFSVSGASKGFSSTKTFNDNVWYYVVATYDNSYVNLYADGTSILTPVAQTGTPGGSVDSLNFMIGYEIPLVPRVFDGLIDEVRVSDTARSVDWIKASFYSETDGIVSWGSEEEGTTTTTSSSTSTSTSTSTSSSTSTSVTSTTSTSTSSSSTTTTLPPVGDAYIKVQRKQVTFSASSTEQDVELDDAVVTANSFIICKASCVNTDISNVEVTAEFKDTDTITLKRGTGTVSALVNIEVVEAISGKAFTVTHDEIAFASGDSTKAETVSVSDYTNCMVLVNTRTGASLTDNPERTHVRGKLSSNTNLDLTREGTGTAITARYQIVEWSDLVTVQTGTTALTGVASNTQAISEVTLAQSALFLTYSCDTNALQSSAIKGTFNSNVQLGFSK